MLRTSTNLLVMSLLLGSGRPRMSEYITIIPRAIADQVRVEAVDHLLFVWWLPLWMVPYRWLFGINMIKGGMCRAAPRYTRCGCLPSCLGLAVNGYGMLNHQRTTYVTRRRSRRFGSGKRSRADGNPAVSMFDKATRTTVFVYIRWLIQLC